MYVLSCKTCQINKRDYSYKPSPLKQIDIPSAPFEILHMDIVTVGKQDNEYKYVLRNICAFSNFLIFIPLKTQQAEEIAEKLYHLVIGLFGPPKVIVTDRGQKF